VPYGIIVYGGDLLELRRRYRTSAFKRQSARWLLGGAAVIVAISHWTGNLAGEILRELGLDRASDRVRVIPLGTDPQLFRPGLDPAPLILKHGLPRGRWLVTVARLVPHKGIDNAIRALARLTGRYPDLRYAVVGQGSYRPALEQLARDEGVADRVHFLNDVSDPLVPLAYALAEVYVGISRRTERDVEGFGIALLEAQASGKPVVGGRNGGMPDAVKEGETGLLVDAENLAEVIDAIASLLNNPARAAAIGSAGRAAVESYYNWSRVIADLRGLAAEATSARR
jgi:phosphatidylinositol alpha-1,6-mannosyltransferase